MMPESRKLIITPAMSKAILPRSMDERASSTSITAIAPKNAAASVSVKPAIMPPLEIRAPPPQSSTSAAPSDAPEFTPSNEGSAKGLANSVCITKPAAESDAPANSATAI